MWLSKKARKGIQSFNRSADPRYAKSYQTPTDLYVKAYQDLKGEPIDSTTDTLGKVLRNTIS